jgi:signal peptidase I
MSDKPLKTYAFALRNMWADYRLKFSGTWFFQQFCTLLLVVGFGALSYFLVSHFIFQSVRVSGYSMYPTLLNNGNYWLDRWVYLEREPRRGDIVEAVDPQDGTLIVKRIVALPGDSIYMHDGNVYLNGKKLFEPYLPIHTPTYAYEKNENEMVCCGTNQYYVMGDNRNNSMDSRSFGPVTRQDILGEVVP